MSDFVSRIRAGQHYAVLEARRARARGGLSPDALVVVMHEKARAGAMAAILVPEPLLPDEAATIALADGIARWAVAASAVAPNEGTPAPALPDEEEPALPH